MEIGFHHLKSLGAPPVNLRGSGNPYNYLEIINYFIKKYIIKSVYFGNWISSPQKFGRAACKLKREWKSLELFRIVNYLIKKYIIKKCSFWKLDFITAKVWARRL